MPPLSPPRVFHLSAVTCFRLALVYGSIRASRLDSTSLDPLVTSLDSHLCLPLITVIFFLSLRFFFTPCSVASFSSSAAPRLFFDYAYLFIASAFASRLYDITFISSLDR